MPANSSNDEEQDTRVPAEPCELPHDIQLVYADARGRRHAVALKDAGMLDFGQVKAFRKPPAYRGQRNFPGWWWSATTRSHVVYESWLQRHHIIIPTHFAVDGDTLLVHLARPNKVWAAIQARSTVVMSVVDDYAYIPTTWRAKAGGPDEDGVPTSYYSAVQLTCRAHIVDDPQRKAELLRRQLAHFQPRGDHAQVGVDMPPYGRMLSGIRGLRLHIASVAAKFKYDDHNPQEHRARVAERLESRGSGRDRSAAAQQRRRLKEIGEWKPRH